MIATVEPLETRTLLAAVPINLDGGPTVATAAELGKLAGQLVVNDQLSSGEANDLFRFTLASSGNFNLSLSGLSSAANLVLMNSRGQIFASSARRGTRTDAISLSLKRGTYIAGVVRQSSPVETPYTLSFQADLNYGSVSIDGTPYTLGLIRADGTSTAISSTRPTWVVIHGWLGTPESVRPLARAIDAASSRDQVLEVDWSAPADDLNPVGAIGRVPDVAAWVASKLNSWGIAGARLNLVGHSMGGYMTDQIAQRIAGGAQTVVALDPATPAIGGVDVSGTNFAAHSQFALSFTGSDFSTPAAAWTADEAIKVNVGRASSIQTHMNVRDLFTGITELNNTTDPGSISPMFALGTLHLGTRPSFGRNAIEDQYEAVLTGKESGGRWAPTALTYRSTRLGKFVTIT